MKRDSRLRDLSVDHHHALVLARRASRAAVGDGSISAREVWTEVVRRFDAELEPHFEIEERILLPALDTQGEVELATRTRAEHAHLRDLLCGDDRSVTQRLGELGKALTEHVRFEERTLFPVAEQKLADETLQAVAEACAHGRQRGR